MLRFFERITQPFPDTPKGKPPSTLWAFCRFYTRGMEVPLILMSLATALLAVIEVSLFGYMGELVDWLNHYSIDEFFMVKQTTLIWIGCLLLLIFPALTLVHSALNHQSLLGNYPMAIRWLSHRYLLGQSLHFYQNDFAGRVATKMMQTALAVRQTVMKCLDVIMYIAIYFSSMLFLVAAADWRFAVAIIGWFVIYCGFLSYFLPRLRVVSTAQADARSVMTGRVVDSYSNIATVKLFAHTEQEASFAKQSMHDFLQTVYPQMQLVTRLSVSVQVLNYCLLFVIGSLSLYLWSLQTITVGAIAVAISLSLRLNGMSQWVMWEISGLFENIGAVADGMHTLSKPISVVDQANAKPLQVEQGKIEFNQVKFTYGSERSVINELNLLIKPGEKIGLVGRSGAGKSTLVNLLLRFYDLESGVIRIDNQNIAEVQQESLRAHIGMVSQDTSLLHRSVRENILYGKPSATEQELELAVKRAQAEFVYELTDPKGKTGLDAQVGERGVKLSGGQRQRIAIARVLLKNAPILVLDEATSALDSEVEQAIQDNLYQLMENKTVIAIAHRLSTIAAMDRLIVLDEGKIIEQGSHSDLVASGGIYSQLWAHQTGGFLGEN